MPRKKNEVNEQEQQLVVYEAPERKQEVNDQKQKENDVPSTGTIDSYFEKFRYFEEHITQLENIMSFSILVTRALNRGGKEAETVKLKDDFDKFSDRVKEIANDTSVAVATAVNKFGDRNVAKDSGANPEKLANIRKEFHELSNRLESFMHKNPANPAVAAILKRTAHIVGDGAPVAGGGAYNPGGSRAFEASPGPNQEERKAFFVAYTDYLRNMVKVSQHKILIEKDDNSTPKEKLTGYLNRLKKDLQSGYEPDSIFYVDLTDFPMPATEEEFNALSTEEGLNSHLKKIDEFLIKSHEKLNPDKLKLMTGFAKKDGKFFEQTNMQEEYLKEISDVLDKKDITWDVKKMYLRNVCSGGFREGLPTKYNVEYYLGDQKPGSNKLKSEEEKIKSAKKWLKELGQHIAHENRYDRTRKDAVMMTHAMYKAGKDNLDSLPDIIKTLDAGKKIVNREVEVTMMMGRILKTLEALRNAKDKPLEGGEVRPSTEHLLSNVEEQVENYLKGMEMTYPNVFWSNEQVQSIGAVIDLVSAFKPENKAKLCARMNVKVNKKGEYSIGGDIPLISKTASQMKEAKDAILDADPRLMKSSPEYKELRAATEKLQKKASDFMKARKNGKLTDEQITELLTLADNAYKCAHTYTDYKLDDLGDKLPNKREMKRLNAAYLVSATANDIKKYVHKYTLDKALPNGPKAALDAVEALAYRHETPTPEDLASMVYLQVVRDELERKPAEFSAEKMLNYKTMQNTVSTILSNNDFKDIIKKMPREMKGPDAQRHVYGEMKKIANSKLKLPDDIKKNFGPSLNK